MSIRNLKHLVAMRRISSAGSGRGGRIVVEADCKVGTVGRAGFWQQQRSRLGAARGLSGIR